MTAPTPEHEDAVARAIDPFAFSDPEPQRLRRARRYSSNILSTTDPAAQAALAANLPTEVMLAALVERGALTEYHRTLDDGFVAWAKDPTGDVNVQHRPATRQRQFSTPWEVVP